MTTLLYWVADGAGRLDLHPDEKRPFGILYVGVTADLVERLCAHRDGRGSAFVRKWACHRLVLAEPHATIAEAIAREKSLKNWNRAWKLRLISEANPNWDDLGDQVLK